MSALRVLVCGGRNYRDRYRVWRELNFLCRDHASVTIIHGAATGADQFASDWAKVASAEEQQFPADWKKHGKAAGPIRNKQMLDEGKPNLVLAFPGGRGTANMVAQARAAGVKVVEVK